MPSPQQIQGWPAGGYQYPVPQDYISGCYLTYNSGTLLTVGTGSCWSNAANQVITVLRAFSFTSPVVASTLYYVYLLGDSSAYATTTKPVNYQGTAWQDGSGNRYIGSYLTTSGNQITNFSRVGNMVRYKANTQASPFNILVNGTNPVSTSVSAATVVPATSISMISEIETLSGSNPTGFGTSDGVTPTPTSGDFIFNGGAAGSSMALLNLNTIQAFLYCSSNPNGTSVFCVGYAEDR